MVGATARLALCVVAVQVIAVWQNVPQGGMFIGSVVGWAFGEAAVIAVRRSRR